MIKEFLFYFLFFCLCVRISPCDPHHKIGEILFIDSLLSSYFYFKIPFFSFVLFGLFWFFLAYFVGSPLDATLRTTFEGDIAKDYIDNHLWFVIQLLRKCKIKGKSNKVNMDQTMKILSCLNQ